MAYSQPMSRRRRATALGLTVAVHLLLALLLIRLAPDRLPRFTADVLATFDVAPDSGEAPTPTPERRAERQPERAARAAAPKPPPPVTPPPVADPPIPEFLRMSRDQFAASDLSRLKPSVARGADTAGESVAAAAGDSSAAYGPGAGPGGARLFAAEWVREPTDAELRTYMPPAPPGSWAMIACRTIPGNQVENCRPLGESPLGSKLATGLRRAAWQFRVRPPRLGGKPMVGEWVSIRIDFTERGIEARR